MVTFRRAQDRLYAVAERLGATDGLHADELLTCMELLTDVQKLLHRAYRVALHHEGKAKA